MADEDVTVDTQDEQLETEDQELSDEERALEELKQAVEVASEAIGTLRRRLPITVPRSIIAARMKDQLDEVRREQTVPGFRRGRAPLRLVEKRFGREIGTELSSRMVLSSFVAVTERDNIKTVGDPMLLVTVPPEKGHPGEPSERLLPPQEALEHIRLPGDGPLVYRCEVDVQPEFALPPLEGIALKRPDVRVTDEDVDKELRRLLMIRGHYAPVEEGQAVQEDDLLVVDLKITAGDQTIKTEDNAQLAARDMVYDGIPLTGLGRAAVGKKAGATVTLDTKIPEEYAEPELRNRAARVEIVIHDVKRLVVPELDEAFVQSVGCESEEELRGLLQNQMEAYLDNTIHRGLRAQVDQYLLEHTKLDIPSGISSRLTERAVVSRMIEKMQQGVSQAEIAKEMDAMRTSAAEETADELKLAFIYEKIGEERDVVVSEEEINGVINEIARRQNMRFDRVRDELARADRLNTLHVSLRNDKIRDLLIEQANISEVSAEDKPSDKPRKGGRKSSKSK